MIKHLFILVLFFNSYQSFSQVNCENIRSLVFFDDTINGSSKQDVIEYLPDISECLELDEDEYKLFFDNSAMYYLLVLNFNNKDTIYVKNIMNHIESIRSSSEYQGMLGLLKFKKEFCNEIPDEDSWLVLEKAFQNYGLNASELEELKGEIFSEKNSGKTYCEIGFGM